MSGSSNQDQARDKSHFSFRQLFSSHRKESDSHGTKQPISVSGTTDEQHSTSPRPKAVHSTSSPLNVNTRSGNNASYDGSPTVSSDNLTHTVSSPNVPVATGSRHASQVERTAIRPGTPPHTMSTVRLGQSDSESTPITSGSPSIMDSDRLVDPKPDVLGTSTMRDSDKSPIINTNVKSKDLIQSPRFTPSETPKRLVRTDTSAVIGDSNSPGRSSLWGQAYAALLNKNDEKSEKLLRKYEMVLAERLLSTSDSVETPKRNEAHSKASNGDSKYTSIFDSNQQHEQLMTMLEKSKEVQSVKGKIFIGRRAIDIKPWILKAADGTKFARGLIDQAVKASPEASVVWSAVCLVLPLITRPIEVEAANHGGLEYVSSRMQFYIAVEDLLFPNRISSTLDPAKIGLSKSLVELYGHILDFQIRSIVRSCEGHWYNDIFSHDDWSGMQDQIKDLESTIKNDSSLINDNKLRELLQIANDAQKELKQLYLQGIKALEALKADTTKLVATSEQVNQQLQKMREDEQQRQLQAKINKCLQALLRKSPYKKFYDDVPQRVEGTCCWFLEQSEYRNWLRSSDGCLLVTADPGCGKSVLAKHLVEHELPSDKQTVCYFFFKDQTQNTLTQALAALLHQMLKLRRDMAEQVMDFYDEDPEEFPNDPTALTKALNKILADSKTGLVMFVLDALDECKADDVENLLNWIAKLQGSKANRGRYKFLLTSRPYSRVVDDFDYEISISKIQIKGHESTTQIADEVKIVIKVRCGDLLKRKRITADVHKELLRELLQQGSYTYLFVYLIFQEIEKKEGLRKQKLSSFQKWFQELPQSVDDAYENMLGKYTADADIRRTVGIILKVMVAALRPLSVAEIQWAVMMELESPISHKTLDADDIEDFKGQLQSWCGLLVQVHQDKVTFLHQTVRDFLLAKKEVAAPSQSDTTRWAHSVNEKEAHALLSKICVAYLSLPDFMTLQVLAPSTETIQETPDDIQDNAYPTPADKSHESKSVGSSDESGSDSDEEGDISQNDSDSIASEMTGEMIDHWAFDKNQRQTIFGDYPFLEYAANQWEEHLISSECDRDEATLEGILPLFDNSTATFSTWAKSHSNSLSSLTADLSEPFNDPKPLTVAAACNSSSIFAFLLKNANLDSNPKLGEAALFVSMICSNETNAVLLIDSGMNPNCCNASGDTALLRSITSGLLSVAKCLLKHGAKIEFDSLQQAVSKDDLQFLLAILEHKPDVNVTDKMGNTALHYAICNRRTDITQILLNNGADVNKQNDARCTALILATYYGTFEAVKLLLGQNADVNVIDSLENTALTGAATGGHYDMVDALLSNKPDVIHSDRNGYTPLHLAARGGHSNIVELLLKNGLDIDAQTIYGSTALRLAAQFGWPLVVEILLRHGADLEVADDTGETALITACQQGHLQVAEMLLDHGAGINKIDSRNRTGLFYAAQDGYDKIVEILLKNKANVDLFSLHGNTALSQAACWNHTSVVKLLLQHDANPNILDVDGDNALMCAALNGRHNVVKILLDHHAALSAGTAQGQTALHSAAQEGSLETRESEEEFLRRADDYIKTMKLLIDAGLDINVTNGDGATPLMLAASRLHDHRPILEYLLEANADVHIRDKNGRTCMHYIYNEEALEVLVQHQPDLNIQDSSGRTPLLHIMLSHKLSEEFDRLTKLYHAMVGKGASLDIQDNQGLHPPQCLNGEFSASSESVSLEDKVVLKAICRGPQDGKPSSLNLDECIGIKDKRLVWAQNGNFSAVARDIKLVWEDRILQAELPDGDDTWKPAYIWLDERIRNINGVLTFQPPASDD